MDPLGSARSRQQRAQGQAIAMAIIKRPPAGTLRSPALSSKMPPVQADDFTKSLGSNFVPPATIERRRRKGSSLSRATSGAAPIGGNAAGIAQKEAAPTTGGAEALGV